jgi:hypothetical protein
MYWKDPQVLGVYLNRSESGSLDGLRFKDACSGARSEIFWTALSERPGGLELRGAAKSETDTFGHEPALVARCCSPAKLLSFPKLVGTPRCNDARRCHQCDWLGQGGRAAMASCRTSEQLRRVSGLTRGMQWTGARTPG